MGAHHRHSDAGSAYLDVGVHDLACLVVHLHLLLRVTVVGEHIYLGNQVVGQLIGELGDCGLLSFHQLTVLHFQLLHGGSSSPRRGLIGGYMYFLYVGDIFNRLQCYHQLCGGTIGVGDDVAWAVQCILRIHFRYHKRHILIHAESAGVINHDGSMFGDGVGKGHRGAATGRDERDVDSLEVVVMLQFFHDDLLLFECIGGSGTP